jgi:hypothetical protein
LKELLEELIRVPGVSGFEDDIRENIAKKVRAMGLKPTEDNIGDLMATVGDKGPHVLFIAHMDELGLVVSKLEDQEGRGDRRPHARRQGCRDQDSEGACQGCSGAQTTPSHDGPR